MDNLGQTSNIDTVKTGEWIQVLPEHCHQRLLENTLVSKIRSISDDKVFAEAEFKFNPQELGFFFDHKIDHLPGMLEINAMRQGTLALAHLIYNVPLDFAALIDWMDIKLYNFGELGVLTTGKSKLVESSISKHKIIYILEGIMLQNGFPLMSMTGKIVMLSPLLASKIRDKKIKIDDVEGLKQWKNL